MHLTDMKMDKTGRGDKEDTLAVSEEPEFPFGLTIHLEEDQIKKLGIETLPNPGMGGMIGAKIMVRSASMNKTDQGEQRSLSLQITALDVGFSKEEKEEANSERMDKPDARATEATVSKVLFGDG